ncbi:MAG: hypothetical protein HY438_02405 [DPANN group archaeon]|nr:hypothetical protein [DPANN group archaeon]
MGIKETLGIKSQEQKDAESILELATGVEQTKQYLGHTKVLLDDIGTKMDEAVAGEDPAAFNDLHSQYDEHNTTYQEMNGFVRELEGTILHKRGEALAFGLSGLIKKYGPVANKNPRMREVLNLLQRNRIMREYAKPNTIPRITSATKLTGKAAEMWALKKKQLDEKLKESSTLEAQLTEKGVTTEKGM